MSRQGPGLQKRTKLQRKYLTDKKMQVKKGSMATLDFGVEKAPKLSIEEQQTGLRGRMPSHMTAGSDGAQQSSQAAKAQDATKGK